MNANSGDVDDHRVAGLQREILALQRLLAMTMMSGMRMTSSGPIRSRPVCQAHEYTENRGAPAEGAESAEMDFNAEDAPAAEVFLVFYSTAMAIDRATSA